MFRQNSDDYLYNLLLTQTVVPKRPMPYDVLKEVIDKAVKHVKIHNINAKISNVIINIDGRLVPAQVYVERKNAFAAVEGGKFGTSPTAYRVELRFPFGLEIRLGETQVVVPPGDFEEVLAPYSNGIKICDDVQRDHKPHDVLCGGDVTKEIDEEKRTVTFRASSGEFITLSYSDTLGAGYQCLDRGIKEYSHLEDYNQRLKIMGMYPLFYSKRLPEQKTVLRKHDDYPGFTLHKKINGDSVVESKEDGLVEERKKNYQSFIESLAEKIVITDVGKRWKTLQAQQKTYHFDITILNDVPFFTHSSLPLTRLRDYQLEIFQNSIDFINRSKDEKKAERAAKINAGVGAGKTFLTFSLLQRIQYDLRKGTPATMAPPFCMAPNPDVAAVTKKTIDLQGSKTGTTAIVISGPEQMPTDQFLKAYQDISEEAEKDAKAVEAYLQTGLQDEILQFCKKHCLYPYTVPNLLFKDGKDLSYFEKFKDSIDIKRLLLIIEGQKLMLNKTGMLGIEALKGLLEQFEAIEATIIAEQKDEVPAPLFKEALQSDDKAPEIKINYDQTIIKKDHELFFRALQGLDGPTCSAPTQLRIYLENSKLVYYKFFYPSGRSGPIQILGLSEEEEKIIINLHQKNEGMSLSDLNLAGESKENKACQRLLKIVESKGHITLKESKPFNLTTLTAEQLLELLTEKHGSKSRAIRDALIKIAFLTNREAAVLLANSGGLGNTFSEEELQEQIKDILPSAASRLNELAKKSSKNVHDHYTLYMYLRELFNEIPPRINYHLHIPEGANKILYQESLQHHIKLVTQIKNNINAKIQGLKKVADIKQDIDFKKLGIPENSSAIHAANQLAGTAALSITGHAADQNADLLLSHIPIFTPEGLACYFELLKRLVGTPKIQFNKQYGVYTVADSKSTITKKDVADRISQILNAVMLADEVHKDEFRFLYETDHPIYMRINTITKEYLGKEFIDILPCRIGMSGTCNEVADHAFGSTTLYDLSIQKMIQKKLVKKVNIATKPFIDISDFYVDSMDKYARRVVIDYFSGCCSFVDLFKISKGLIFYKGKTVTTFNKSVISYFNLLIKNNLSDEDPEKETQDALFKDINDARKKRISSSIEDEKETEHPLLDLTPERLQKMHRTAFHNNLFALYLEYLLSRSSAPMELSDIVGKQNQMAEKNKTLMEGILEEKEILQLIHSIDPKNITAESVGQFLQMKMPDAELNRILTALVMECKNNYGQFIANLPHATDQVILDHLVTEKRDVFESGKTFVMLGSTREQTGYSHEPVGIIMDVPLADIAINQIIDNIQDPETNIELLYPYLDILLKRTFSYHEKNQIGGRALRTPYGHVQYVQYQTKINAFIHENKFTSDHPMMALKIETDFNGIFTADEKLSAREQRSITFNRRVLELLGEKKSDTNDIRTFASKIQDLFVREFKNPNLTEEYSIYLNQRLPLLWALKHRPHIAAQYFTSYDGSVLNEIRAKITIQKNTSAPQIVAFPLQPEYQLIGPSILATDTYRVHQKLLDLTNRYLDKANDEKDELLQSKRKIFTDLKEILAGPATIAKLVQYKGYLDTIQDEDIIVNSHRNGCLIRSLYLAASALLVPLFCLRAAYSKYVYGTLQFWNTNTKKSISGMKDLIKPLRLS